MPKLFKEITDSFTNLHRYGPHKRIKQPYNPHLCVGIHNHVKPFTLHLLVTGKNSKRTYFFLEFIFSENSISFLEKTLKT